MQDLKILNVQFNFSGKYYYNVKTQPRQAVDCSNSYFVPPRDQVGTIQIGTVVWHV